MNKVRIAIWGLGRHAILRIIPALLSINEYSIIGVCSRSNEIVEKYSKELNCKAWTSPEPMLTDENVDVVYISTPIGIHASHVKQVLESGKHAWCEKPLTCDLKDTTELIYIAKKNKLMLAEALMYLYHPQFDEVKNFVESDNGKVKSVVCRFGLPQLENPGFRADPSLCGGAFWDVAIYPISAVTELFSSQKVKVLFAEINNSNNSKVDTDGFAVLQFSGGTIAFLEWGLGFAYKNEIDVWSERESFFSKKIFSKSNDYQPEIQIQDLKGNETIRKIKKSEQFILMFCKFNEVLSSGMYLKEDYEMVNKRAIVMNKVLKYVQN